MAKKAKAKTEVVAEVVEVVAEVVEVVGEFIEAGEATTKEAFFSAVSAYADAVDAGGSATQVAAKHAIAYAAEKNVATDWVTADARVLPAPMRELYDGLVKILTARNHSKPAVFWKRVRDNAAATYAEATKGAGVMEESEGGEGGNARVKTGESARQKLTRLTKEDIGRALRRILESAQQDADAEVKNCIPHLQECAKLLKLDIKY